MLHPIADILQDEFLNGRWRCLRIADQTELGDFVPEPSKCHDNARRWEAEHRGYKVIEGSPHSLTSIRSSQIRLAGSFASPWDRKENPHAILSSIKRAGRKCHSLNSQLRYTAKSEAREPAMPSERRSLPLLPR